jgi:amino acid permease
MQKKRHFYEAIATLVGCIIGAGVLGIPYVVAQAGFITGLLNLIFLGLVVMLVYLYFGEVVLRTKGDHQLTGYAEKYLGRWGKRIMMASMVFGIYGALVAYILGEGAAFQALMGGKEVVYQIGFLFLMSILIYYGIRAVEESELLFSLCIVVVLLLISVFSFQYIKPANLINLDMSKFFVPYGVVLFSYLGMVAIPEVKEELKGRERQMKKAIIIGVIIPIVLYVLFAFICVGVIGIKGFNALEENQRIATIALGKVIGNHMVILGNLFAVFAMATSFLALGLALMEMFVYDYKINKILSWFLTCIPPLVIALSGVTNFIGAIAAAGVIAGGTNVILIVLMVEKAKEMGDRKPEYSIGINNWISLSLIGLFVFGATYYLFSFF